MVQPANTVKIVKKTTSHFTRPYVGKFKRLRNTGWRKPRGIDSAVRRRFKGRTLMPNIGYGSDKRTKFLLPCGFYKYTVKNVRDLKPLTMVNTVFAAEIFRNVSAKKRAAIIAEAKNLDIHIINPTARLATEAHE